MQAAPNQPAEKKAAPAPAAPAPAPAARPVPEAGAAAGVPAFLRADPAVVAAAGMTAAPALSAAPRSRVAALVEAAADPDSPAADPGPGLIRAAAKGVAPPGVKAAPAPKAAAPAPAGKAAAKPAASKSAAPASAKAKGAKESASSPRAATPVIPITVLREAAVKAEAAKREEAAKSAAEAGAVAERLYVVLRGGGVDVPRVMGLLSGRSPAFAAQVMEAYSFSGGHLRATLRQRLGIDDAIQAYALLVDGHAQQPHVGLARAVLPAGTRDAELFRLLYGHSLAQRQRIQAAYDRTFGAGTGFPLGTGSLRGDLDDDLSGWRLQKAQALLTRDLTQADELYFDSLAIEGTHTGAVVARFLDLWEQGPRRIVDLADEWDRVIRQREGWTDLSLRDAMDGELSGDDWRAVKTVLDGADRYRREVPKDGTGTRDGEDVRKTEAIRLDVADRLLKVATTERMGTDEALMTRAIRFTRSVHKERAGRATGNEKQAAEAGWKEARASLRAVVAAETSAGGADHRKARLLLADELSTVDELYLAAADADVERAVFLIARAWAEDTVDDLLVQARRPRVDADDGVEIRPSFNPRIVAGGQGTLNAFRVDAMLKHGTRAERGAARLHWELEAGTGDADLAGAVAFLSADGVSDALRRQVVERWVRTRLAGGAAAKDPASAFLSFVEQRYGNTPSVGRMRDLVAPPRTPREVLARGEQRHQASTSGVLNAVLETWLADYDLLTGEDTLAVERESLERLRFIAERAGADGPELRSMTELLGLASPAELAGLEYGLFIQRLDEVHVLKRTAVDAFVVTMQLALDAVVTAATGGAAAPLFLSTLGGTVLGMLAAESFLGDEYEVATKENAAALVTALAMHGMGAGVRIAFPADAAAKLTRMRTLARTAGTEALAAVGVAAVATALEPKLPGVDELQALAAGIALNAAGGGIKAAIPVGLSATASKVEKLRTALVASMAQSIVAGNAEVTTALLKAPEDLTGAELAERYLRATGIGVVKGAVGGMGDDRGSRVDSPREPSDAELDWHGAWQRGVEERQRAERAQAAAQAEQRRADAARAEEARRETARQEAARRVDEERAAAVARAAEERARVEAQARAQAEARAGEAERVRRAEEDARAAQAARDAEEARIRQERQARAAADEAARQADAAASIPAPAAEDDAEPEAPASSAAAPKRRSTPRGDKRAVPARTGSRGGHNTRLRREQKRRIKEERRQAKEQARMEALRKEIASWKAEPVRIDEPSPRRGGFIQMHPVADPRPVSPTRRERMPLILREDGGAEAEPRTVAMATVTMEASYVPPSRSAEAAADEHRGRHDAWMDEVVRLGRMPGQALPRREGTAPPAPAGTAHDTPGAAYAEYESRLAEHDGAREVGIFRNAGTGEYRVMVGTTGAVGSPRGEGWETVMHYHPNRDNVLSYRMPSPTDAYETLRRAVGTGRAMTEFVEWPLPGGGRGRATFTATPDPVRFYVEYRDSRGDVVVRVFRSHEEYQQAWTERTRHVPARRRDEAESARQGRDVWVDNPDYVDLVRDLDRFYLLRRRERGEPEEIDGTGAAMTGVTPPAAAPGTASSSSPAPDVELENPLDFVVRESSHAGRGRRRGDGVEEPDDPRWKLTRQDELTYVQYDPRINPEARWRAETRFTPPAGGGTMSFGPRSYRFDADGNLTDAWTSRLELGVRDPVMYDHVPGIERGEDYGHLLGIDFGHVDAQLGHFGGFRQAAHVNRPTGGGRTPRWYNAEREVLRLAVEAHKASRDYLVVARADGHVDGRPRRSRICLVVDGTVMFDSGWIDNPAV